MFRYQALINMEQNKTCSVCLESDDESNFVYPCKCKGTGGGVHLVCINKWISQSGDTHCKVCGGKYSGVGVGSLPRRRRIPVARDDPASATAARAVFKLMIMLAAVSIYVLLMSQSKQVDIVFLMLLIFVLSFIILKVIYVVLTTRMEAYMEDPDDDVTDLESSMDPDTEGV
mgnify:CR=1 FL=1